MLVTFYWTNDSSSKSNLPNLNLSPATTINPLEEFIERNAYRPSDVNHAGGMFIYIYRRLVLRLTFAPSPVIETARDY